jgi:uncharacterized membrane protein YdbT with pleckstrin-like domain
MPYPTKLLNRNEEIALDLRPHWWYFGRQILTGIPLLVVVILVLNIENDDIQKWVGYLVAILVIAWAVWLGLKYLSWARTYFVVTNQRVVYRTGVVARRGAEIPLDRITNINFTQRMFERIIGAGNLEVQSAGEQGTTTFDFVRHPDGVQQEIYRQMDAREHRQSSTDATAVGDAVAQAIAGQAAPSAAPAAAAPSVSEQFEQLARLRDEGHITPAEYEAKRAELLDRM